jgi:hypothetical protein
MFALCSSHIIIPEGFEPIISKIKIELYDIYMDVSTSYMQYELKNLPEMCTIHGRTSLLVLFDFFLAD